MSKVFKTEVQIKAPSSRRSLRRINRLLEKNLTQFQIPNPYRSFKSHPCLPQGLRKQLSQLDYLSIKSLQNLHFHPPFLDEEMNQLLLKMKCAVKTQAEEFHIFIDRIGQKTKKCHIAEEQSSPKIPKAKSADDANKCESIEKQFSLEARLEEESLQGNLPLVMHQSQGASMMSDNYEADRLSFQLNKHFLGNEGIENEEHLESSYQI